MGLRLHGLLGRGFEAWAGVKVMAFFALAMGVWDIVGCMVWRWDVAVDIGSYTLAVDGHVVLQYDPSSASIFS